MSPEVSVIMPAYRAEETIAAAAFSALHGQGVAVELVICSDDGTDYRALLRGQGVPVNEIVHLHSPAPRSGPSAARNLAVQAARGPVLAALDADDAYAQGRLRQVLDAMSREGVGAGTGPTREQTREGGQLRIARAADDGGRLSLETITTLRMPFSPVFERQLSPAGWPPVGFAEDMVLNAHLCAAAGGYAFAEGADYFYFIRPGSVVQGEESLESAALGYRQILDWLPDSWLHPQAREAVGIVIREDQRTLDRAMSARKGNWRAAFRQYGE